MEINAITYFTEMLVSPLRRVLDLQKVPLDIRTPLWRSLDKFGDGISTLILGSGSGGVVPDAYSANVMKGRKIK